MIRFCYYASIWKDHQFGLKQCSQRLITCASCVIVIICGDCYNLCFTVLSSVLKYSNGNNLKSMNTFSIYYVCKRKAENDCFTLVWCLDQICIKFKTINKLLRNIWLLWLIHTKIIQWRYQNTIQLRVGLQLVQRLNLTHYS